MKRTSLLVAILVVTNRLWLWRYMNESGAVVDRLDEAARQQEIRRLLQDLVLQAPRTASAESAHDMLREVYPGEVVKYRGDSVEVGSVRLVYSDGLLRKVLSD